MKSARILNCIAMLIFGSIGLFVRMVPLPTGVIALVRGCIGGIIVLLAALVLRPNWHSIWQNRVALLCAGVAIGFNWMLLFEAYRHTTIAIATVCYYFAPVLIALLSAVFFRERLRPMQLVCIFVSLTGLVCISWAGFSKGSFVGILFGLGAAVLYAAVVLCNKGIRNVSGVDRTFPQLIIGGISLIPYILLTTGFVNGGMAMTIRSWLALALIAVVHTGVAYVLYFSSIGRLPGTTAAVLSFLDPLSAILFAAVLLGERMSGLQIVGVVLVLAATLCGEVLNAKSVAGQAP